MLSLYLAVQLFRAREAERACAADPPETYTYYTISDPLQSTLPNPIYACYASNYLDKTAWWKLF